MHQRALYNAVKTPKLLVLLGLVICLLTACYEKAATSKNVFSYNEATGMHAAGNRGRPTQRASFIQSIIIQTVPRVI